VKIHVGCGDKHIEGYKHCDVLKRPHVDYVCNAWEIPVASNTVSEIYCRHMLEHLDPDQADKTIRKWLDILKPGGMAHIIVPNLEFHCKQFFMDGKSKYVDATNREHAMAGMYGWYRSEADAHMHHKWGYISETLVSLLYLAGFSKAVIQACRECDLEVKAYK
jgi:predicted SAM-dependent methyltransferase